MQLASKGAEHRYAELKAEVATLIKHFPHLEHKRSGRTPIDVSSEPVAAIDKKPHTRRRISAAGRAAISAAQKKRWAAIKKGKS